MRSSLMAAGVAARTALVCTAAFAAACTINTSTSMSAPGGQTINPQFGLTCLYNATGKPIPISFRWGDESWHNVQVEPGQWAPLYWQYGLGVPVAPYVTVVFDADATQRLRNVEHTLRSEPSPNEWECENFGRAYEFDHDAEGTLGLYATQ